MLVIEPGAVFLRVTIRIAMASLVKSYYRGLDEIHNDTRTYIFVQKKCILLESQKA